MAHMRICPPCKVKFLTDEPAGCPRCGASSFFTMRETDIGTRIWLERLGLRLDQLEQIEPTEQPKKQG